MRLTTIHADGLKNLAGYELELSPLTILAGANGSGKTSTLQAIRLSVLGYEPSVGKRLLEVRNQLAAGTANVETGLNFDNGFGIRRTFGASHEASVSPPKGETTLAAVQKRIDQELGGFVLSLDLAELLDKTPEKRREYVFGLLPRERAELTEELFRSTLEYAEQEDPIRKAIDRLWLEHVLAGETAVEGLASAIEFANRQRLDAEQQRRAKEQHAEELEQRLRVAGQASVEGEEYRAEKVKALEVELDEKVQELGRKRGVQQNAEREHKERRGRAAVLEQSRRSLDSSRTRLEALNQELDALPPRPDVEALLERYNARRAELANLHGEQEEIRAGYDAIMQDNMRIRTELATAEKALAAVSGVEVCPTCGGTADLEAYRERQRAVIQELLAELRSSDALVAEEAEGVKAIAEKAREVNDQVEAAREEQEKATRQAARFDTLHREVRDQETHVADLERILSGMEEVEVEPLELEDLTPLEEVVAALRNQIQQQNNLAALGSRVAVLEDELERARAEVEKAERREQALKVLHARLKTLRGEVIQGMMRPIEETARRVLHSIDPAKTFRFQYDREGREVLDFGFEEAGHFRSFSAASNGESAFLVVVLLAALLEDLSPPWKALILDNVEAIDAERRARLLEAIEAIQGSFDNVILAGCCGFPTAGAAWQVVELAGGVAQ